MSSEVPKFRRQTSSELKRAASEDNSPENSKIAKIERNLSNTHMASSNDAQMSDANDGIDMDLYSRQIGAFGVETMGKLIKMNVLIVGLQGIGVESAKNLILAGPASVTLLDDTKVGIADLGTNFFLRADDVGQKTRAQASLKQLAQLNSYVNVTTMSGPLTEAALSAFQVVVLTTGDRDSLIKWNAACRSRDIAFIAAQAWGVTGSMFSDFGDEWKVHDEDGEPLVSSVIDDIKASDDDKHTGVIFTEGRHKLQSGDSVVFEEVDGCDGLNDGGPWQVKIQKFNRFAITDPNIDFSTFEANGMVMQEKVPKTLAFRSLADSLVNPVLPDQWSLLLTDFGKFGRAEHLHFARLAIWEFEARNQGQLPELHNSGHADQCVALAKDILAKHKALVVEQKQAIVVEEIDEDVVRKMALYARAELVGITSFFGGVVAQEIVKYTGKYTPLRQWAHIDAFELVGDEVAKDAQVQGSRYDHQIAVFGQAFQNKLHASKYFVVGAGALGCELLKELALMGVGVGSKGGKVFVTDMDRIEVSNLNRQFLFRKDNVGHPKSTCAAAAANAMNPDFTSQSWEVRVGPDTEDHFDDAFWDSLDGVVNALDNVGARKYVDSKCVWHGLPLLESGTLGTKANSQVILPARTQSYGDSDDPEEDTIPMCTLRNFPHLIEHCIEWSRAEFATLFADGPHETNSFLKDREKYLTNLVKEGNDKVQLEKLKEIEEWLELSKDPSFETCVRLAHNHFFKQFRSRLLDLIAAFPEDARVVDSETKQDKGAFWSGSKRFPQALDFDASNHQTHIDFVLHAANLFAFSLGVPENNDRDAIRQLISELPVPEHKPSGKKMEIDENGEEKDVDLDEEADEVKRISAELRAADLSQFNKLEPSDFEKDDDSNHHIDFITSCSNLRATNYRIKVASRHKCKMIAGKIIPALATTTAMITGLVGIEFYKLVLGLDLEQFRNAYCNLGVGQILNMTEPVPPKKTKSIDMDPVTYMPVKAVPEGWTSWDKITIDAGDLTVEEFCAKLTEVHHGVQLGMLFKFGITDADIAAGKAQPMYNSNQYLAASAKQKNAANFKRKVSDIYNEVYEPIPQGRNYLVLDAACESADGDEALIPRIKFIFRK